MQVYVGSAARPQRSPVSPGMNGTGNGNASPFGSSSSPWALSTGRIDGRSASIGIPTPSSLPRSSSFSTAAERAAAYSPVAFASAMRETHSFPSTFEDDESQSDTVSDTAQDFEPFRQHSVGSSVRGRDSLLVPDSRSRSQSMVTSSTSRPGPGLIGSTRSEWSQSHSQSFNNTTTPLSIPGRYNYSFGYDDPKVPGSRYGSLGALARSPTGNIHSPSPPSNMHFGSQAAELSNISPFVRNVDHIFLDEDTWNGGDSGATSRRHSFTTMHPRRGVTGFGASDNVQDESSYLRNGTGGVGSGSVGSGGNLAFADDELAVGLNSLNLNSLSSGKGTTNARSSLPPSQPSSLPIYAPLSRHSMTRETIAEKLTIPEEELYMQPRRAVRSPSENAYARNSGGTGISPTVEGDYDRSSTGSPQQQRASGMGRTDVSISPQLRHQYVPQQYMEDRYAVSSGGAGGAASSTTPYMHRGSQQLSPQSTHLHSPLSPTLLQQPYVPSAGRTTGSLQRRASQALASLAASTAMQAAMTAHPQPTSSPVAATSGADTTLAELGRGIPLHAVPPAWSLYIVQFKAGRTDLFYVSDPNATGGSASIDPIRVGDQVIVEADRGKDLGTVINDTITAVEVEAYQRQQQQQAAAAAAMVGEHGVSASPEGSMPHHVRREINPKKIYGKATAQDMQSLAQKLQDEEKALLLCQTKVRQKKLPMEVIDAEYQWDRRKLTFYFIAEKRIDFRELVRELFRLYKTRIWMASLQGPTSPSD